MYKKNLNLKPLFFKVFFTYLLVYFLALVFRYNYDFESLFNNIQYKYLITLNMVCVFLGIPLTTIFDFILIKLFGLNYVLFFSPVISILSVIQVFILRKINFNLNQILLFFKEPEKNYIFKFFEKVTFRSSYILLIRSLPILPHVLGSYIIASSKIKNKVILINTFIGTFFYYFFLFLIIEKL